MDKKLIVSMLVAKRSINTITGCWNWTGSKLKQGYGAFKHQGRTYQCHRISYKAYKGPIPAGKLVCHACDNPACFNPDHLEAKTQSENMLDSVKRGRHNMASKTHCKRGHEFNHWNTIYLNPEKTWRACFTCSRMKTERKAKVPGFCRQGHEKIGHNLYVQPDGRHRCRKCMYASQKAAQAQKRSFQISEYLGPSTPDLPPA